MLRHTVFPAAALLTLLATQPAAADSCKFETSDPAGSNVGPNGSSSVFEIDDFSFDIEQTLNIGSQGSGAGAGKVALSPFQITKKIDSATPLLLQSALNGETFRGVKCSFYSASTGTSSPYLTALLTNAIISEFKVEGSGDGIPRVKFWIHYEKIEWQY